MSTDPFAQDSYDQNSSTGTAGGGFFQFRLTSPDKKHPNGHNNHQRTASANAFPSFGPSSSASPGHHHLGAPIGTHDRTVSEDIDDHMYGSPFAATDICPACQMPRGSTIQCSVTQLHHATDLPCETPKKRQQNRGFFSRLRESFQSHHTEGTANPSDSQPTSAVHKEVPLHPPSASSPSKGDHDDEETGSSSTNPSPSESDDDNPQETTAAAVETEATTTTTHHAKTQSGTLFGIFGIGKTKEEKNLQECVEREEHERKRMIHDFLTLDMEEMHRQCTEIHKAVRHALKAQAKARLALEVAFKEEFDRLYLERKGGLEEIRREHLLEAKLTHKKEKERKKHSAAAAAGNGGTATESASSSSVARSKTDAEDAEGGESGTAH